MSVRTVSTRLLQLAAMAGLGGLAYAAQRVHHAASGVSVVLALGLFLTCGTLAAELLEVVRIPHLTAYLLIGVVAGPHVLNLVDHGTVDGMQTFNALALSLIAFAGGAE